MVKIGFEPLKDYMPDGSEVNREIEP